MKRFCYFFIKSFTGLLFLQPIFLSGQASGFTPLPVSISHIDFENTLIETPTLNALLYQYLYNGGGVAAGDINNDGLCDLFFTGNMTPDRLYLNKGGMQFEDITQGAGIKEPAGWSTGVTMADVNADGLLDIYVCRSGQFSTPDRKNLLWINNGNTTFTEKAAAFGLHDSSFSTQAAFFDMDRDGDLDMFLLNHAVTQSQSYRIVEARIERDKYAGNKLYRNDNGYFTNISDSAGINGSPMNFGLGLIIGDINNDMWPDIFVTNDYQEQDYLYLNNKNGTFTEIIKKAFGHTSNFSMGCDMADINNDGYLDLFVLDMLPEDPYRQKTLKGPTKYDAYQMAADYGYFYQHMHNTLQLNNGDNSFSEIAWSAGVAATDWSWAPLIADFDNDGAQDIYITNGYRRDFTDMDFLKYTYGDEEQKAFAEKRPVNTFSLVQQMPEVKTPNYIFRGTDQLIFENKSAAWGVSIPSFSNGAAYADLDNDGDLDIAVNNINDTAFILMNNVATANHFIRFRLHGEGKNSSAIGTRVILRNRKEMLMRELMPSRGFQSSSEPVIHFGLGKFAAEETEIIFPSGKRIVVYPLPVDTLLDIFEKNADDLIPAVQRPRPLFIENNDPPLEYIHTEMRYEDFKREPLLLHKLSEQGPSMTSGDVNGDQLTDIFITGGRDKKSRLFIGTEDGFIPSFGQPWERDSAYEDIAVLMLDADLDGDTDIFIASGSNEYPEASRYYAHRLYLNTGNGRFSPANGVLPQTKQPADCARTFDFDNDGDEDILIGGAVTPGRYPESAGSMLWRNDRGIFTDVTSEIIPDFDQPWPVTDIRIADINGDSKNEIITAGEWSPVKIYFEKKGVYTPIEIPGSTGLWNTLAINDTDNDGDQDIAAGNLGSNHPLKAPAVISAYDFDGNGTIDPIIEMPDAKNIFHPIASRDDMLDQIPALKKKYVYYADYAKATLSEMFAPLDPETISHAHLQTTGSGVFVNKGIDGFYWHPFPPEAQWFPIYSMVTRDVNGDNFSDIIVAGNSYGMRPEHTRMDAGKGLVILNDPLGGFSAMSAKDSGLSLPGEVRDMQWVRLGNERYLFVLNRNAAMQIFSSGD